MAIAWTYTESSNTAVVTGGTSGSPATFVTGADSFVTWDRANAATLLAAHAPASNLTLTYQIRPVENLALLISFVVASKTTEADYIFITGTDAWDAAQTESIDVSAGNGTYVSTKRFRTITNIDCSDNAAGGGTVWADGTVAVTQPQWGVVWNQGNFFRVDSHFTIGNGSTSTYFTVEPNVSWQLGYTGQKRAFNVTASATFQMGRANATGYSSGGTFIIYPSASDMYWGNGTKTFYTTNIIFYTTSGVYAWWCTGTLNLYSCTVTVMTGSIIILQTAGVVSRVNFAAYGGTSCEFYIYTGTTAFSDIRITDFNYGLVIGTGLTANATITDGVFLGDITKDLKIATTASKTVTVVDANISSPTVEWVGTSTSIVLCYWKYTCNIHVADKSGTNLSGVSVACEDTNGNAAFTTQTTAADGTITPQTIVYRDYKYNAGSIITTYSPHKFTISKAGFKTLVLNNITIDGPIDWHIELQQVMTQNFSKHAIASWA